MLKKIGLPALIVLYVVAGINHFWHPDFYYSIIPPYLPNHYLVNIGAGFFEVISGFLLIFPNTRKFAVYLIVAMLIAFIPAHVYMTQKGGCMNERACIPLWQAWARIFLQPLLIFWAWYYRK